MPLHYSTLTVPLHYSTRAVPLHYSTSQYLYTTAHPQYIRSVSYHIPLGDGIGAGGMALKVVLSFADVDIGKWTKTGLLVNSAPACNVKHRVTSCTDSTCLPILTTKQSYAVLTLGTWIR